jgi:hypothetical protein
VEEAAPDDPASPPPAQPKQDALDRLEHDIDAWVATADDESGTPLVLPLSLLWQGVTSLIATPASSPTSRNLQAHRLGIGPTRDLVLIQGTVHALAATEIPGEVGDAFAAKPASTRASRWRRCARYRIPV